MQVRSDAMISYRSAKIIHVLALHLDFVCLKIFMFLKSSFGALEDAGYSWQGFGILILILIWSLVFDISLIQILALSLDFEGAKNIHILQVIIWSFSWVWRLLIGVWHLGLHLDMVNGLCYTYIPNFGTVFWIWRCKEHLCPLTPDL